MDRRLPSFKARSFFLCLVLFLQTVEARVNTEIQAGPLYRVEGAPLSVSCNVSGFSNANDPKQFEFRVSKPARPTSDINIISTGDANFAYAMYSQRVSNGEITLKHLGPNNVLFEIERLQKDDEGEYECFVVNPEMAYDGTYQARTTVKVIDNSLSVSSPVSSSLSYTEGGALTATCQASSNTIQHTHLSFAWYLRKDAEENAQPIISLNRDFTLSPGQGFEGRYRAGTIRLDKIGEATYRLTMAQLELSDQGRLYCQAQEWIQDPDGSWFEIAQKEATEITVDVKAREVIRDTSSLVVRISAQQTTLQEGQELSLSCHVDSHKLEEKLLTVAWLRSDGAELARIGPTGILSVGPEYSGRQKEGELRAARIEDRHYRLMLQPVRTEDKGEYICQAWPEERGPDGAFIKGNVQKSQISLLVSISATESGLSVEMQPTVNVKEGDGLSLSCEVKGVKGPLSVSWQYQPTSTATAAFRNIISVNQEGVAETGDEFVTRKVTARRPAADTFVLQLDEVKPSDSGVYHCAVSEWKTNSKISSQSQSSSVTVAPVETFVNVHLISRKTRVTVGEGVELLCRVRGPNAPVTLTWSLKRDASSVDNILTVYADGSISWSEDQQGYQLRVVSKPEEVAYYLLINSATHREAGNYQCRASAFLENVYKKLPPSNQVAVMVQNPESKLVLMSSRTLTKDINSDIEIQCSVESASSTSSRYALTWTHQHQGENRTLVSSDRDALMTFGAQVEVSSRRRISMRRIQGPSFRLTIRQAQTSDDGFYVCEVVEWLQDPRGNWYQLAPVTQATKLKVNEPANDLRVQSKEQRLTVTEGQEVELQCDIVSGSITPSFFYKIAWLYSGHDQPSVIVELDHTGLLKYAENKDQAGLRERLGLRRPSQSSFGLSIQRAHQEDGGSYWCQVNQYQMDQEGQWQQKASDTGGPIRVAVNVTETNLSLLQHDLELNVTALENFIIPCHIAQQSSRESEFEVTWFRQKDVGSKKQPIFMAYRNGTLQDMIGKGTELRFDHPLPNQYSLTVTKPGPENNGLYFCEVEEWLPTPSRGWRNTTVGTSGYLTVNVWAEESVPEPWCQSGRWIGIFVPFAICSLLLILILAIKLFRSKTSGRKEPGQSLWAEEHPLKTKPNEHD